MWRAYRGVIHGVFDQIPNLQNCFTTPNQKPRKGGDLRQINICRQVKSLCRWNFKKSRHLGLESISYFVHGKDDYSHLTSTCSSKRADSPPAVRAGRHFLHSEKLCSSWMVVKKSLYRRDIIFRSDNYPLTFLTAGLGDPAGRKTLIGYQIKDVS